MTSPAKQRLSLAGIGRVLFCALSGALVCSVLLVFLEGFRWIGRTSESGGFVHNFFWISLLLGLGLVAMIGSVVFVHFVMGWLLAVPMVVLAMILLLIGAIYARDRSATAGRQCAGLGLLMTGMIVLFVTAFSAASLSLDLAISVQQPQFAASYGGPIRGFGQFLGFGGGWLLPPLLMSPGLSLWTNWSTYRRFGWCLVLIGVPPSALVMHQILTALGGPLTT